MKINFNTLIIGAFLIALMAPVFAELPSDAVNINHKINEDFSNKSVINSTINSTDSDRALSNLPFTDLTTITPAIFEHAAFSKDTGGFSSGDLYATNIKDFMSYGTNANASKVAGGIPRVGLVHWPWYMTQEFEITYLPSNNTSRT